MCNEIRAFLPSYETVTVFHLRDLCSKKRTKIHCDDVKVIQLPHFPGLKIDDLVQFAETKAEGKAMQVLPVARKEILKLPRAYLATCINTVIGEEF